MNSSLINWGRLVIACCFLPAINAVADEAPAVESYLLEGKLTEGAAAMQALIAADTDDQNARFSLGVVQFLQAIEGLGQDHYRYGLLAGRARSITFMRLPLPENKTPEEITYVKARAILQDMLDRLQTAEKTLAAVQPENVKLPLKLGMIHLDLNGDGEVNNAESMWHITQTLQRPTRPPEPAPPKEFPITFDAGDVIWLQGYCHFLSSFAEVILAYDWQDQFERTAHLAYPKVDSPYEFLAAEGTGMFMSFGAQNILDVIAAIHTINYELVEPERMQTSLQHLETVIALSRKSWTFIEAETDDNHEWVPNSEQTSVMRGFNVTAGVMSGWQDFLDEFELILQGKKLVPFWRGIKGGVTPFGNWPRNPDVGINVRKIFTEPTRFDLALWLQGTGLKPYLESGDITAADDWTQIMRNFQGQFFNFALWFN